MKIDREMLLVLSLALLGAVCAKLGMSLGSLRRQVEDQQNQIQEQDEQLDALTFCQGGDAS